MDKKELSRITIDMPIADHKRLKAVAAILGKSMRDIVMDAIKDYLDKIKISHKKALSAIIDSEANKNVGKN
jgi:ribosomal 50S subunit-associated protein YjgA (DUF615 family)